MKLNWKQKLIFCMSFTPFMVWLSIFNGMQWDEYKWNWSDNNAILAMQYMINGLWCVSTFLLPVVTMVVTMSVITSGLDTKGLDR